MYSLPEKQKLLRQCHTCTKFPPPGNISQSEGYKVDFIKLSRMAVKLEASGIASSAGRHLSPDVVKILHLLYIFRPHVRPVKRAHVRTRLMASDRT